MYFDAVEVKVKTFLLLFRLALAILCVTFEQKFSKKNSFRGNYSRKYGSQLQSQQTQIKSQQTQIQSQQSQLGNQQSEIQKQTSQIQIQESQLQKLQDQLRNKEDQLKTKGEILQYKVIRYKFNTQKKQSNFAKI